MDQLLNSISTDIEVALRICRKDTPEVGNHGPVALGIPLLDPVAVIALANVALVRDIEVALSVDREGGGVEHLADGRALRGKH
jgi:hypothetical protein